LDEVAPAITSGSEVAALEENSTDALIYTATATDDGDVSGGVTFSLKDGSDQSVSINAETGAVTLNGTADHETQSSYSFTVVAMDAAGNKSEQVLSLSINDLDEADPVITSDNFFTIDENGAASAVVYTATATDDGDISAGVTYSLGEGSNAAFSIDSATGAVTFAGPANFEGLATYVFTVVATDGAGNTAQQAVTMSVNNLDEVAPVITSGDTAPAIDENSGADQIVYTATATDDGDVSEGVTFSLKEGSDPALTINAQTGAVTLTESPDFETQESYTFTVVATDGANNSSEKTVTLAINDLDDARPTFTSAATGAAFTATPYLYEAVADDSADVSAGITYSLSEGGDSALLQIDSESGVVSVRNGLVDPMDQDSYTFTVIADDGVTDPVSQTVTLTVPEANVVQGAGVLQQGGIRVVDIDNGDGTYTLEFYVDDAYVSNFPDGVGNYDFIFSYDPNALEAIADTDYTTEFALPTVNAEVAGTLVVGAIDLNALDLSSGTPLGQLLVTPVGEADVTVQLTSVIVNDSDLPDTIITYGSNVVVTGTEAPESFVLGGGEAEITAGVGVDVFVATATTGDAISITDFTNDDVVDFSAALIEAGYNSNTEEATSVVSGNEARAFAGLTVSDLDAIVAGDAAFDNAYGVVVDSDAGQLVGFYDANSSAGTVEMVTFRLNIGEAAAGITDDVAAAQVNTGAAFLSGSTAGSVTENFDQDQIIYTAAVELEEGQTVTYSLEAGVENLFTIDANTGEVTFVGVADYEASPTLSFTVIATDNEGNSSRQAVTVGVTNVDDTAPVWVSGATDLALAGTPFLYQAEADDSADVTVEPVQYSLDPNSADFDLLAIDTLSGVVSLKAGVLVPEGKNAFTFTVVAFDGVNDPVSQQVVTSLSNLSSVQGTGVLSQGGIKVVDIDNGDGSYTLEFYVDQAVTALFPDGVENYDFVINYSADQFEAIADSDYVTEFALPTVNAEVAGTLVVGAIDLSPLDLASGTPLGSLTVTPVVENDIAVSITNVIVNNSDLDPTSIVYGDTLVVSGTADNEAFTLLGGESEITGGGGVDAYILTSTSGTNTIITDFMPGEDIIDMTSLLLGAGYTSLSDLDLGPATSGEARENSQTSIDMLELLQANDFTFDNAFGMLIDSTNGKIIAFYDADSDADSIDIVTFEINIGEAVADITLDDLAAGIGGFIA